MFNSQLSRIGKCKWHNCSCQSGEVGENMNGQFHCANCGHQINDHFTTNDDVNNNMMNVNQINAKINVNAISQLNQTRNQNQYHKKTAPLIFLCFYRF